jgi:hypothetical protein
VSLDADHVGRKPPTESIIVGPDKVLYGEPGVQ